MNMKPKDMTSDKLHQNWSFSRQINVGHIAIIITLIVSVISSAMYLEQRLSTIETRLNSQEQRIDRLYNSYQRDVRLIRQALQSMEERFSGNINENSQDHG